MGIIARSEKNYNGFISVSYPWLLSMACLLLISLVVRGCPWQHDSGTSVGRFAGGYAGCALHKTELSSM